MKVTKLLLALSILISSSSLSAQAPIVADNDSHCQVMEVHCKCENPNRDFVIPRQKIGKTNDTDQGACWTAMNITNLLKNVPMTYCMKDASYEKDPTKPQTKCTATWTCKQSCDPTKIPTP